MTPRRDWDYTRFSPDPIHRNARMLYTCTTPGCEVVGHFTDEPGHCSICLEDLTGVYDHTGELASS